MPPMIAAESVSKRFGDVRAVADATLSIEAGELMALLGPSGCGKTTLLRLLAGFEEPDQGRISIAGTRVAGDGAWHPPERRGVGVVFQDYALFPHLTVAENVAFGLGRRERNGRPAMLLRLVGLEGLDRRYPHELSGGQQQRVALARALAPEPSVVLLDEPWSNIDPLLRSSMREELALILREVGVSVLLVTHDREEAFSVADRIALMSEGEIVQVGSAEAVYLEPRSRWAAEFVGGGNFVSGRLREGTVETALGAFPVVNANGHVEVEALIRPELLVLEPSPAGPARVVGREFRGHDVFYRLRLDDGSVLVSHRPSTEVVPLGTRVLLKPHRAPIPVF
jgi:iron(III) transport system ATP-binding protein